MLKTSLGTEGYMAPEVFNKKANYHGVPNDIFSAGVIFFIFMTGLPPFKKAIPKDPFYGQMCINRHTKFWGEHERRLKMKFSEEFKTLINAMLSYDPTHRPSIAEIYASDWLSKGKIPTDEEIKKEFTVRKQYVDAALEAERLEKEAKKKAQKENQDQMTAQNFAFGNIQVSRSKAVSGNETMINTAECWADITTRFADVRQEIKFRPTEKGSVTRGNIIGTKIDESKFYHALAWLCEQKKAKVTYGKPDKLGMTFNFEGSKIDMKVIFYNEQCEDGLKIAEFMKLSGCICAFHEFVTDIKKEFESMITSE